MSVPNTHLGPTRIGSYLDSASRRSVFFIGIGGIMMSSLALLTARAGYSVSGSDRTESDLTRTLEAAGITVYYAHGASNLPTNCALAVYTVAISEDNPELAEVQRRGIPCVSRADYLGYLMTGYTHRVGVAGMHGKSTCTSMCAQIFLDAHADPTVLSGAVYTPMGGAYRIGGQENFIFEACEYMDSFLDFRPTVAILLGEEWEHVDYFKSMEQIRTSFAAYASLTGPDGITVVNADDPDAMESARRALASGGTGSLCTFSTGNHPDADFTARAIRTERGLPVFELVAYGKSLGEVKLAVPGRHQVCNALAAAAAAHACGIAPHAILKGLASFCGASRRMEYKGDINGSRVYDDYGHHPTEIRATLGGARELCDADGERGRLLCVFQPHTYSRTAELYPEFLTAFDAADRVLLIDIYSARETDDCGVSSAKLAHDLCTAAEGKATAGKAAAAKAAYCPTPADAAACLRAEAQEGDLIVIMGAGDVTRVTAALLDS
jgi:UDP-N-acetylmuramate--alanine ligase